MRVKKRNSNHVLRRYCALLLCFFWSGLLMSEPLKLATSSWPPYIGHDLPNQGVAVEIVTKAFERAGVSPEVIIIPSWKDVREGMEVGVYDVILGTWYSDERARFHLFSEPFMMNRLDFIRKKGSDITYDNLSDLEGLMVATVNEYAYGEEFDAYPGIYQVKSNHVVQSIVKLLDGKADLALGDAWVIRHELKNYMPSRLNEIEELPTPLSEKGLRIAVSIYNEKSQSIIKRFNAEITKMKKEGEIDAIIATYKKHYNY